MKKRFGLYAALWAVLLALFNVIAFVSVGWAAYEKYTPAFWTGYTLITVMFAGQLICAFFVLKEENAQKLFYRISLIKTSYSGLITTFVIGGLCMLLSPLPCWICVIVCAIVLAANVLTVLKATIAIDEVERIDRKVKQQTFFIKALSVDADALFASAKNETIKVECKKVADAIRYSDPVSNDMLASIESQITMRFATLSNAVAAENETAVSTTASELLVLIEDRNNKCKLLK